jgi:hypothetical protein
MTDIIIMGILAGAAIGAGLLLSHWLKSEIVSRSASHNSTELCRDLDNDLRGVSHV